MSMVALNPADGYALDPLRHTPNPIDGADSEQPASNVCYD
jgi:hypothetical protein